MKWWIYFWLAQLPMNWIRNSPSHTHHYRHTSNQLQSNHNTICFTINQRTFIRTAQTRYYLPRSFGCHKIKYKSSTLGVARVSYMYSTKEPYAGSVLSLSQLCNAISGMDPCREIDRCTPELCEIRRLIVCVCGLQVLQTDVSQTYHHIHSIQALCSIPHVEHHKLHLVDKLVRIQSTDEHPCS